MQKEVTLLSAKAVLNTVIPAKRQTEPTFVFPFLDLILLLVSQPMWLKGILLRAGLTRALLVFRWAQRIPAPARLAEIAKTPALRFITTIRGIRPSFLWNKSGHLDLRGKRSCNSYLGDKSALFTYWLLNGPLSIVGLDLLLNFEVSVETNPEVLGIPNSRPIQFIALL